MNLATPEEKETALHQVAQFNPQTSSEDVMTGMTNMGRLMLQEGAQVNAQDAQGWCVYSCSKKYRRVCRPVTFLF